MINSPNSSCIVCGLFPEGEWLLFVRELDQDGIPLAPFHLPYKAERSRNKFHPWFLNEVVRDYGKLDFPEGQAKVLCLKLTEEAKESPFEKIMLFREKDLKRHYLDPLSRRVAKRYFALTPNQRERPRSRYRLAFISRTSRYGGIFLSPRAYPHCRLSRFPGISPPKSLDGYHQKSIGLFARNMEPRP